LEARVHIDAELVEEIFDGGGIVGARPRRGDAHRRLEVDDARLYDAPRILSASRRVAHRERARDLLLAQRAYANEAVDQVEVFEDDARISLSHVSPLRPLRGHPGVTQLDRLVIATRPRTLESSKAARGRKD